MTVTVSAINRPLTPSPELAAIVGATPLGRADATSAIWVYIKKHSLQNPANKREILADNKLRAFFGGADKATMFELPKYLGRHLSK